MILGNFEECVPSKFYLRQNSPNPFREMTIIKYCLPFKTYVKLTLLDSSGNIIKRLVKKIKDAGTYEIKLVSNGMQSGTYQYQLEAFDIEERPKLVFYKTKRTSILDK